MMGADLEITTVRRVISKLGAIGLLVIWSP